jgi:hypothetical protein
MLYPGRWRNHPYLMTHVTDTTIYTAGAAAAATVSNWPNRDAGFELDVSEALAGRGAR